jgi:hypothetical protein
MQRVALPIKVSQRIRHELPVLSQKTRTADLIELAIDPELEQSFDLRALGYGARCSHRLIPLAEKLRVHVSRDGVEQSEGNEVDGVIDLPVDEATARTDLDESRLRDEVGVAHFSVA